ncbi:unnamed protein product [Porites evermanni]|uniref:Caspase family p20 domain-containing protein n=1 Tax=Porites evermanni TaxID=104178 RepID=A0ABN8QC43_9CNID|nr:unnamed protein product [Porites evermanni]
MQAEKNAPEDQQFKEWENHPCCVLLPSPEKLDISMNSPGSDVTDTLEDFQRIKNWANENKLLNTGFPDYRERQDKQLEKSSFKSLVQLAFSTAFVAMRNTRSPDLEELVFWFYTGHGLGTETAKTLEYLSTPCLSNFDLNHNYLDDAIVFDFVQKERKVQGGELCLHMGGFCDLYGLLKPWIAAVKSESINAPGQKKNKHLVVILDSCHSGIIAQELKEFERQVRKKDDSFLKENSVTIQAACGPNERTFGGYFTPVFLYLNDPQNKKLLEQLRKSWKQMTDEKKDEYRSIELPSPMVVTTRASLHGTEEQAQPPPAQGGTVDPQPPLAQGDTGGTVDPQPPPAQGDTVDPQPQNVTMEINVQNFKLTLFPDAGFFKFCSLKVFQYRQAKALEPLVKERALYRATVEAFMKSKSFKVLDYKLKTYTGTGPADKNAGSPKALFLLDDPHNPGFAVCAHVHFKAGSTDVNDVQRINLVHHKRPPGRCIEYVEDGGKFRVNIDKTADAARELVKACRQYVDTNEPGRWNNVSQWNMTGSQLSVNGQFRLNERSAWEQSYLTSIKKYKLPEKVPANSWHRFPLLSSFFVLFAISFHFYLNMRA